MKIRHLGVLALLLLQGRYACAQSSQGPLARDPFWPVGYTPPRRVVATPTPTPTADERERVRLRIAEVTAEEETAILGSIKMEGFLRTSTSLFAIMNQQIVSVGEKIRIRVQGRDREFMILDLTEETIRLRPL